MFFGVLNFSGIQADRLAPASTLIGGSARTVFDLQFPDDLVALNKLSSEDWRQIRMVLVRWGEPKVAGILDAVRQHKSLNSYEFGAIIGDMLWIGPIASRFGVWYSLDTQRFEGQEFIPGGKGRSIVIPWRRRLRQTEFNAAMSQAHQHGYLAFTRCDDLHFFQPTMGTAWRQRSSERPPFPSNAG